MEEHPPERQKPAFPGWRSASRSPGSPCWRRWSLAIPALRHARRAAIQGDTDEVRNEIDSLGVGGPLLILALALIHTVVIYPAEIVNAAAGFAYGFFPALALVTVGWMASALLCYVVGRGSPGRCSTAGSATSASSGSRG